MTSASHIFSATAVLVLAVSCADIELDTIKDGGSTVPVPDMDGPVSFAENGLTGQVLVSGTAAAVTPFADVIAENASTSVVDRTAATDLGAFSLLLTDAEIGDTVSLTVEVDGETSDPIDLPLVYEGEPPAAPFELQALTIVEQPGLAEASGIFIGELPQLIVRVVNDTTGQVVEGSTVPAEANRGFEIAIAAEVGDVILVNGTDPAQPSAPGRFASVEVTAP